MAQTILSIQPSQKAISQIAKEQGYVWIKTQNGFITKDTVNDWGTETTWYKVMLNQKTYGITWAFTKGELE